jgi:hypothetical protein
MSYDFRINPSRSVQTLRVGQEGQPVLVLDDCMLDPQSLVRLAADQQFAPSHSPYPGLLAPLHPDYVSAMLQAIRPLLAPAFGLSGRGHVTLYSCFFGLVTTPPQELQTLQRQPHIDTPDPGRLAVLHYLCDPSYGGTAFFRHRQTGWESLDADKHQQIARFDAQDPRPVPPGYLLRGNASYERTASIPAKFNRVLVYRSRVLHCAEILRADSLSPDPRVGRLTANLFFEFPAAKQNVSEVAKEPIPQPR